MYQRFFSARNEGVARKAVLWTLLGVAFMEWVIILTAWVASSLEPSLEIHGLVIAHASRNHLPLMLRTLMLTAIMAIVLSTAASYLLAPATCLVRDVYQRFFKPDATQLSLLILLRVIVVLLGVAAYYLSTLSAEFLSVALLAYTIHGAGITPALLAAFFGNAPLLLEHWSQSSPALHLRSSGTPMEIFPAALWFQPAPLRSWRWL